MVLNITAHSPARRLWFRPLAWPIQGQFPGTIGQKDLMDAVATKVACARVIQASPLDDLEPFRFRLKQNCSKLAILQKDDALAANPHRQVLPAPAFGGIAGNS
jgi:hypothetical protein